MTAKDSDQTALQLHGHTDITAKKQAAREQDTIIQNRTKTMQKRKPKRIPILSIIKITVIIIIITVSSMSTSLLWNKLSSQRDNTEIKISQEFVIEEGMTVLQFSEKNSVPRQFLKEILNLHYPSDLHRPLSSFALSQEELRQKLKKALAIQAERQSKNWLKIPIKFFCWFIVLLLAFFVLRKEKMGLRVRKIFYLTAVVIFGIVLGADPSPMGPIKDTIALYGTKGVLFKPRLVALAVFLLAVLVANKFICAWGCQFGTLQDLLFCLQDNESPEKEKKLRYRPSFKASNTIRILFVTLFTLVALAWATDIIEPIDPFKLYKPAMVTTIGWGFLGGILLTSIFVYRPWCHFFCPFGLLGWLVEQISLFRIRVCTQTCTDCRSCVQACPSTAMKAILQDQRVRPDCFACGSCLQACPTRSISFSGPSRKNVQERPR